MDTSLANILCITIISTFIFIYQSLRGHENLGSVFVQYILVFQVFLKEFIYSDTQNKEIFKTKYTIKSVF